MELGTESNYKATRSRFMCTASESLAGQFEKLTADCLAAEGCLAQHLANGEEGEQLIAELQNDVEKKRRAVHLYNRYSVAVRGASAAVYGILQEADIVEEFRTLLSITLPLPSYQHQTDKHMRPLERVTENSPHTSWMFVECDDCDD
jgi:hypothetical protein